MTVGSKRPGNLGVMNKSQTLPRSMGSKAIINNGGIVGTGNGGSSLSSSSSQRPAHKSAATPPAVRRQFSVSYIIFIN